MGKKEKEILIVLFTQTLTIAHLSGIFVLKNRCEKLIQERCLRIILNDYKSNCDALLNKSSKSSMELKRVRTLAIEIFKTLNNQNPSFMRKILYHSPYVSHKKQNLFVNRFHKQQLLAIKV